MRGSLLAQVIVFIVYQNLFLNNAQDVHKLQRKGYSEASPSVSKAHELVIKDKTPNTDSVLPANSRRTSLHFSLPHASTMKKNNSLYSEAETLPNVPNKRLKRDDSDEELEERKPSFFSVDGPLVQGIFQQLGLSFYAPLLKPIIEHMGERLNFPDLAEKQLARLINSGNTHLPRECIEDIEVFIHDLLSKKSWALQVLDAWGKPGRGLLRGHLQWYGNYDLCVSISYAVNTSSDRVIEGDYYIVYFKLPYELVQTDLPLTWHLCLPSSCPAEALNATYFNFSPGMGVFLSGIENRQRPVFTKEDSVSVASLVIVGILVLMVLIGTVYDVTRTWSFDFRPKETPTQTSPTETHEVDHSEYYGVTSASSSPPANGQIPGAIVRRMSSARLRNGQPERRDKKPKRPKETVFARFLLLFSLPRSSAKIFNQTHAPDSLKCLHGIKTISIAWIILGLTLQFVVDDLENGLDALQLLKTVWFQVVLGFSFGVDTFFVLSGVLTAYLFLNKAAEHGKVTGKLVGLYYFRRFWRLAPAYMAVLLVYTGLAPYFGEGPAWKVPDDARNCRVNWWTNVLYVNNLVNTQNQCMQWSWYLAAIAQFHIVAPLILLPLAFGLRKLGVSIMVLFGATHIATQSYLMAARWDHLQQNNNDFNERYIRPYTRVAPYVIGLFVGHILQSTDCKPRVHKLVLAVGWLLSLAIALVFLLITYTDHAFSEPWTLPWRTVFEVLSRVFWSLMVGWVVFACSTGHGGFVSSILSWEGWLPYSRLTYGVYLVHVIILKYFYLTLRELVFYTLPGLVYRWIGYLAVSHGCSYVVAVLVEVPFLAIDETFISRK